MGYNARDRTLPEMTGCLAGLGALPMAQKDNQILRSRRTAGLPVCLLVAWKRSVSGYHNSALARGGF